MTNLIKVMIIFFLFIVIIIPISLWLNTSPNHKIIRAYEDATLRTTCPFSPEKMFFQECFKKDLAMMASGYTPNDAMKIFDMLENLYQKDKFHSQERGDNRYNDLLFYENWIIMIENAENMEVGRKDSSFLDIPLVPYVQYQFQNKIRKLKHEFRPYSPKPEEINQIKWRWQRVNRKFGSFKTES